MRESLADHYPTQEAWLKASEEKVKSLLGQEEDLADVVFSRIQRGIASGQE